MITESIDNFNPIQGSILALDLGAKKIGIAISDRDRKVALPFKLLIRKNIKSDIEYIVKLAQEELCAGIVIGMALSMDGSYTLGSEIAKKFATMFAQASDLPVLLYDERFSTKLAHTKLTEFSRKKRDAMDDMVAASTILEEVLRRLLYLTKTPCEYKSL